MQFVLIILESMHFQVVKLSCCLILVRPDSLSGQFSAETVIFWCIYVVFQSFSLYTCIAVVSTCMHILLVFNNKQGA